MKLAKINTILLSLVIAINVYVIAAPLAPAVTFWWQNRGGTRQKQLATQTSGGATGTSGGTLTNTGIEVLAIVSVACAIIFIALMVKFWRKPAKKNLAAKQNVAVSAVDQPNQD